MIIYDEYGRKSYFVFNELTDSEKQAMIGVPKYYEVLGNIYENPELAKEIKETWKSKEEKNNG